MSVIYQFRRLVFALVLLGIVAFCMAARIPGMMLIAGTFGAMAWYVTEGPAGLALPRWLTNLAALVVAVWVGFSLRADSMDLVVLMGHFIMWLQVVLLYTNKSNREYGQLLVLSVLLITAASTLSMSMLYGITMVLYCLLALVTILYFQFKLTSDKVLEAHRQAAPPGHQSTQRTVPIVGRGHRWQFRLQTILMAGVCFAVAALLFVLIPRSGTPFGETGVRAYPGSASKAGFSTEVRLNSTFADSALDQEPVLHLHILEKDGRRTSSHPTWLLRGAVMDRYDPAWQLWSRSPHLPSGKHLADVPDEDGLVLAIQPPQADLIEARIDLLSDTRNILFTLEQPPVWIAGDDLDAVEISFIDLQIRTQTQTAGISYHLRMPASPLPDYTDLLQKSLNVVIPTYDEVLPRPSDVRWRGRRQRSVPLMDEPRPYASGWEVETERVRAYAQRILEAQNLVRHPDDAPASDDAAVALALAHHLQSQFRYALSNPSIEVGKDPVVEFLLTHQEGHCELFAAGLAAMARSLGLPARVVTGYRAVEFNNVGGYYVVRRQDAHAWTEVQIGDAGNWMVLDATPPRRGGCPGTPAAHLAERNPRFLRAHGVCLAAFVHVL